MSRIKRNLLSPEEQKRRNKIKKWAILTFILLYLHRYFYQLLGPLWPSEWSIDFVTVSMLYITGYILAVFVFILLNSVFGTAVKSKNSKWLTITSKFVYILIILCFMPSWFWNDVDYVLHPFEHSYVHADQYYKKKTELLDEIKPAQDNTLTVEELKNEVIEKGFVKESENIEYLYNKWGLYKKYITNDDLCCVAEFNYYTTYENKIFWWIIRLQGHEIYAIPASYILNNPNQNIAYSENDWIMSYSDGYYYKNIQDGIINIGTITKDKLDEIVIEEYRDILEAQ